MKFEKWYEKNEKRIINNLMKYLSINTVSPYEERAYDFLEHYLTGCNFSVEKCYFNAEKLSKHSKFSQHVNSVINNTRFNVRGKYITKITNRTILFNCHIDVVPDNNENRNQFSPIANSENIVGRGACDTKANLIALVETIRFLRDTQTKIDKNIILDLVVEEEITGNGTLMQIIDGISADFVIVMEPTKLRAYRGHRGVLTIKLRMQGNAGHMGDAKNTKNIHNQLKDIIYDVEKLEQKLIMLSEKNKNFRKSDNPVKINIGKINGGEWPGSLPSYCDVVANIGFLDGFSCSEIENIVRKTFSKYDNINVFFPELKNEPYIVDENNMYLQELLSAINKTGITQTECYGWNASCDAHYFAETEIPAVIFGCGNLKDAHSRNEIISRLQIKNEIEILINFLTKTHVY